jgi:hypothetical protein
MDHPSDASSTTGLQSGIKKLYQISHAAAYLCCQIQEVTNILSEIKPDSDLDPMEKVKVEDLTIMDKLTTAELMELSNLENTRQTLVKSWRYVENRKEGIIQQAKSRIDQQVDKQ